MLMLGKDNRMEEKGILYTISLYPDTSDIRWMGLNLGTAWNIGIHNYDGIKEEFIQYNNYNYEEEKKIFCTREELVIEHNKIYKFDNLVYLLKKNADNINKVDNILKIMKEANIDYTSHTSFRYRNRVISGIYNEENMNRSEIIFSILKAYEIDDTILIRIFENLKDIIDMKEIKENSQTIGMNVASTIKDKYIRFLKEKEVV